MQMIRAGHSAVFYDGVIFDECELPTTVLTFIIWTLMHGKLLTLHALVLE